MYKVSEYTAEITVDEYFEGYVDIPTFAEACSKCPNHGQNWGCPPFDFDVEQYWKGFTRLKLIAHKLDIDPEYLGKSYTQEELGLMIGDIFFEAKKGLDAKVLAMEKDYPGSQALAPGGACSRCKTCARVEGKPCRFPDELRHSIEALGGNVGLTIEKLMGIKLEWIEEGKLPGHFVFVNGLLIP